MSASALFDKLNLTSQRRIVVIDAPPSLEPELAKLSGVEILRDVRKVAGADFVLAFATSQARVDALSRALAAATVGDAVVWFAYPKGTSKRYQCDFNRDTGFDAIRAEGFDSVRMVAIDDDWSAMRFRRVAHIKPATARAKSAARG